MFAIFVHNEIVGILFVILCIALCCLKCALIALVGDLNELHITQINGTQVITM